MIRYLEISFSKNEIQQNYFPTAIFIIINNNGKDYRQ